MQTQNVVSRELVYNPKLGWSYGRKYINPVVLVWSHQLPW